MTYLLPAEEIRREITVSNSRFIATLTPVTSPEEARAFILRIRKQFADAAHNVPAYILGGGNATIEYCSDDGEPSGTAGRPALSVLRGSGMGDVGVVVTRYFGGTKLGKGGLVRAYTEATQRVARAVPRARRMAVHVVMLALPYPLLERVRSLAGKYHGEITGTTYTAEVTMRLRLPVDEFAAFQKALQGVSAGSLQGEVIETTEVLVRIRE